MNIPDMSNSKAKLIETKINQAMSNNYKCVNIKDVTLEFDQHDDRPIMDQLNSKGYKWRVGRVQTGRRGNYNYLEITWN